MRRHINDCVLLLAQAALNEEQGDADDGGEASSIGPLDLPSHKAAGQHIDALQDPDDSHKDQQDGQDTNCEAHGYPSFCRLLLLLAGKGTILAFGEGRC
jgi:hypothetical protein